MKAKRNDTDIDRGRIADVEGNAEGVVPIHVQVATRQFVMHRMLRKLGLKLIFMRVKGITY